MSLRKDAKYNASMVINYMHTHLYPAVNTNFMLLQKFMRAKRNQATTEQKEVSIRNYL